jgi:hypothetical protein
MRALLLLFACVASAVQLQAGLGMSPAEAEKAYGPNRLGRPTEEDFTRLQLSPNIDSLSEHTLSNRVQVAVGYLYDRQGDLRAVVARYTFPGASATPPEWLAPLQKLNADGQVWHERNLSPGARLKRECLRDDHEARFRWFEDAAEAIALHRDYDEAAMGETHRKAGVRFPPPPAPVPRE